MPIRHTVDLIKCLLSRWLMHLRKTYLGTIILGRSCHRLVVVAWYTQCYSNRFLIHTSSAISACRLLTVQHASSTGQVVHNSGSSRTYNMENARRELFDFQTGHTFNQFSRAIAEYTGRWLKMGFVHITVGQKRMQVRTNRHVYYICDVIFKNDSSRVARSYNVGNWQQTVK